jgi:hypothetical protein
MEDPPIRCRRGRPIRRTLAGAAIDSFPNEDLLPPGLPRRGIGGQDDIVGPDQAALAKLGGITAALYILESPDLRQSPPLSRQTGR